MKIIVKVNVAGELKVTQYLYQIILLSWVLPTLIWKMGTTIVI